MAPSPAAPRRPRRAGGSRPAATPPHAAAQLPGHRACAVRRRDDRPRAAAVHRRGERRGAALHPGPAPVDLRLGEGREQLLRLRHGQRRRAHRRLPDHQAPHLRHGGAPSHPAAGENVTMPCAKVMGAARGRARVFRPRSLVNISAMSFGSLSAPAVRALNEASAMTGALHNTGEGGLSQHHRHGGDLVFQIGTAYFGCRDLDGAFDLARLTDLVASAPVRALEIKLSQGAKPGLGGVLPAAKVSAEIAEIRGVREGEDCISPSRHAEFHDVDSMLDWVELLAQATGLPVGIKSAVGDLQFWQDLAAAMADGQRGVDFITVDGGEGGTGAAPLTFSDSVPLPFRVGFPRVYSIFAEAGLTDRVVFIGSGKLGLADNAVVALALGCDLLAVAREAMLSIGCIQTLKCHTDRCPVGVATQDPWLAHGLDPTVKSVRAAGYIRTLRRDLLKVAEARGTPHPGLIAVGDVELLHGNPLGRPLRDVVGYRPGWGQPSAAQREELTAIMSGAPQGGSAPQSRDR